MRAEAPTWTTAASPTGAPAAVPRARPVNGGVHALLADAGLGDYCTRLDELGYDNLPHLLGTNANGTPVVEDVVQHLSLPPSQADCLRTAVLAACQGRILEAFDPAHDSAGVSPRARREGGEEDDLESIRFVATVVQCRAENAEGGLVHNGDAGRRRVLNRKVDASDGELFAAGCVELFFRTLRSREPMLLRRSDRRTNPAVSSTLRLTRFYRHEENRNRLQAHMQFAWTGDDAAAASWPNQHVKFVNQLTVTVAYMLLNKADEAATAVAAEAAKAAAARSAAEASEAE